MELGNRASRRLKHVAWATILCAAVPSPGAGQGMAPALTRFLQQTIGLTAAEVAAVDSGKAVGKALNPADHREMAVFGIVRIDVPRAYYVSGAANWRYSLRSSTRPRFAIFSDPAVAADVATLSLSHDDIKDLAKCRTGSCKLKLSTQSLAQLPPGFDANAPGADSLLNAKVRQRVLEYVTTYRARGNAGLVVYVDREDAESAAVILDSMLSRSPYLYQYAPSLERYLKNYPQERPAGIREVLFWALDDLPKMKRTFTITHAVVYSPPELPGSTFIVAKQLYADHYLDGGLELTAVLDPVAGKADAPSGRPSTCYVVVLNRLHFDNLPNGGILNLRGKITGKLRDETVSYLGELKSGYEGVWAQQHGTH